MKELNAYKIMSRFLEDRYFRCPSDDLGAPLSALMLQEAGEPADRAIIKDWEQAVQAVTYKEDERSL